MEENQDSPASKLPEEIFQKLNASAEKALRTLQDAYEAGIKAGMSPEEKVRLLEALQNVQNLRDGIHKNSPVQDSPSS